MTWDGWLTPPSSIAWWSSFSGWLLVAAGWTAFRQLPVDAFPDVTNVQVTVISQAPTMSPLEIEQLVTAPGEVRSQGFVLPVARLLGLEEEPGGIR